MSGGEHKLYLVDGTSQLFRAFFALPPLTNKEGLPTNAVYGFATMMRKLIAEESPGYLAVAWDTPGDTFRHESFPDYKANREEFPEDLVRQLPYAKRVCGVLNVPALELEGFEADDLIATLAHQAKQAGLEVVVVASDKDLLQLVDDRVTVLNPTKEVHFDRDAVKASFGVFPEQVVEVQGLMGDSVDNIPGVPGVGEKTAKAVIGTYDDLETAIDRSERFVAAFDARDALLEAIDGLDERQLQPLIDAGAVLGDELDALLELERDDELAARWRETRAALDEAKLDGRWDTKERAKRLRALKRVLKAMDRKSAKRAWHLIQEHADDARLSRQLATLCTEAPVRLDVETMRARGPDRAAAHELFGSLGFRGLTRAYEPTADDPPTAAPAAAPTPVEPSGSPRLVTEPDGLGALARAAEAKGRVALRVATDGGAPRRAELVGLALYVDDDAGGYVPLAHEGLDAASRVGLNTVRETLGPLFADRSIVKHAHDSKAAIHVLGRHGMPVEGWGLDTLVGAFMLDPDRGRYPVTGLLDEHLGLTVEEPPSDSAAPVDVTARIEQALAAGVLRLAETLRGRLDAAGLLELYETMDGPLLPLLARIEATGIRVDIDQLATMSDEMEQQLDRLRDEIHELAGTEFNVDSPKQLREVLFERLGLKSKRKTAKSKVASTDHRTLEELSEQHPIAAKIVDYREIAKLKGTYVDTLPALVDPETGRVHTSFHPEGAATGRLSSSDPNLQNIPVRTAVGRRIRAAFVPDPGHVLLACDYSQIELRILAQLCGDPELLRAFQAGEDIHRHTAALVAGVPIGLVTADMRRRAKAVNFGILYGMSQTRLAREQGISRAEAKEFMDGYFERFGHVRQYIEQVREQAQTEGAVRTLFGRIRYFPQLHQRVHRGIVEQALRAAVNSTLQGTAADLMKLAMLRVDRALRGQHPDARILLQVHDELLLEAPADEADAVGALVRTEMENVHRLEVPLLVELKTGASWDAVT